MQTITRVFEFDAAHRVMNQTSKCKNLHGHRYRLEATFQYDDMQPIGYPIDFSDVKRVLGGFIDKTMDHGIFVNPQDYTVLDLCAKQNFKTWIMHMKLPESLEEVAEYVNPTAENIIKEIDRIAYALFEEHPYVKPYHMKLYETPNCWVEMDSLLYGANVDTVYQEGLYKKLAEDYLNTIGGFLNYDDRTCQN